jgi:hypothetical protein
VVSQLSSLEELFAGRHFDREVIILCVRWYLRYKLSFRDLVEVMAERGLNLAQSNIVHGPERACIQALVAESSVEAFDVSVQHRSAGLEVQGLTI